MSNAEASKLYENIIEEVVNESRQDFEDSGIDEATLQDLRKIWCEKLTQARVARFSWDDEIEKKNLYSQHDLPDLNNNNLLNNNLLSDNHLNLNMSNMNNMPINYQNNLELKLEFGNGLELPNMHQQSHQQSHQLQNQNQNRQNLQNHQNLQQQQFSYPQADNGIGIELPNDDDSKYSSQGLMLPRINQTDGTFTFTLDTSNGADFISKLKQKQKKDELQKKKVINQYDGTLEDDDEDDDDIFNDSDDINSDLDEGLESEKSDEEDGDQEGQIMLCLYDKVQRVKNKWKSNLKEGIANIDGRDYVFQKATGESEW